MNVLKNFAKVLGVVVTLAFVVDANAQWGGNRGRGGWEQVDEVHFTDSKTAVAIRNCKNALAADRRCSISDYQCSPCSEIAHSDHSSYVVYQMIGGGHNPGPGRPGRPGRPGGDWGHTPERQFLQTFHFYDEKTAVARQKCDLQRSRMTECSSRGYECTPCSVESHTDHSQFDLYRFN